MRLQEYGRPPHKRKEYVYQPDLLLAGVDVSKAKHSACLGTQTTVSCRKVAFTHTREGFRRCQPARIASLEGGITMSFFDTVMPARVANRNASDLIVSSADATA